jgi:hypothetical protein
MTVPHYGKRNAGALTAASPGDTLHFNFASYNDSGDSEALTGFAVTDIEVFKNGLATARATDSGYSLISDTGQIGDRVGLYRFSVQLFNTADDASFYASGSWYQVAVDSVTIDGKTVRAWVGSFEIGEPRANMVQIGGDTGASNWLRQTFAVGFADTGINERLGRIQSDVDTGLRVHIDDLDTGLHAHISDVDTGLHSILQTVGVLVTAFSDTGVNDRLAKILADTDTGIQSAVNVTQIRGDTGGADRFYRYTQKLDTGGDATVSASVDTGQVNQAVWQANAQRKLTMDTGIADQVWKTATAGYADDTGTFGELLRVSATASVDTGQVNQAVWQANAARGITAIADTGMNQRFAQIQSDVDTGLRTHINDLDTGLHDTLSDYDTGVRALLTLRDTGAIANAVWGFATRGITASSDTGINERLARIQSDVDTGLRVHIDDLDTGLHAHISDVDTGLHSILQTVGVLVSAFSDTGVNNRLAVIAADTDTGIQSSVNVTSISDTGINDRLGVGVTFDTGGWAQVNIRKVNSVRVQGAGDTGAPDTWRPGT